MSIMGNTFGMGLPKPNLMQTDPSAGDYVKGKEKFLEQFGAGEDGKDGADGRSIHFFRANITSTGTTLIGPTVPQTGGLPLKVGDLGISLNGNLYEYTGDNDYGEHYISYLATLFKDGKAGASIHYADIKVEHTDGEETSFSVYKSSLSNNGEGVKKGDLLLSKDCAICSVTSVDGNKVYAVALANITGASSSGGLSITDDGNGNVTISSNGSASITDDGNGNVVIS